MVVSGSNSLEWNNNCVEIEGEETLGKMGKEENKVEDVEEGEISDTASVEEISEEDFIKQETSSKVSPKPKSEARVWTVQDLYKYQVSRGYASNLYNLAWAQAVQNKPLNDIFVMEVEKDEKLKRSSSTATTAAATAATTPPLPPAVASVVVVEEKVTNDKVVDEVVIDDSGDDMDVEKEDGELEEGEIDLDSETIEKEEVEMTVEMAVEEAAEAKPEVEEAKLKVIAKEEEEEEEEGVSSIESVNVERIEIDSKEKELEKRVDSIREALGSVNVIEAEKSFEEVCSRVHSTLESLQEVFSGLIVPTKDALVQLSFTAIQAVHSVFCSMNISQKEQNKDNFLRLISYANNCDPPLFSSDQIKEIEVMKSSVDSVDALSSGRADSAAIGYSIQNNQNTLTESLKQGLSSYKAKGALLPLLDLHKDHDADSLPSPTREAPSSFPVSKGMAVGDGMTKLVLPTTKLAHDTENSKLHLYETDAFKAVSSYQQKFGRSSFFTSDMLPSPTPSADEDNGDGDTSEEVSSSSTVGNVRNANLPILGQSIAPSMDSSSMQGLITAASAAPTTSGLNPPIVKASAKSRDPRLRLANSDVSALDLNQRPLSMVHNAPKVDSVGTINSRKQKNVEEPSLEGPALKRQRNGLENPGIVRDVKIVSGSGGWLEDAGLVGPQLMNRNLLMENAETDPRKMVNAVNCPSTSANTNVTISGNEQVPVTSTSTTASLPALLKDIAVKDMLINILVGAQQMSVDPAKSTTQLPSANSILGAVPLVNVAASKTLGLLQKPAGTIQVPSQIAPMSQQDDSGKIRMKPRDPRRILHGSALQKSSSLGHEQLKTIVSPISSTQGSKDNMNVQKQEGQADTKSGPSQSAAPPDFARLFTKNLKNIADMMSVSPISSTQGSKDNMNVQKQEVQADTKSGPSQSVAPPDFARLFTKNVKNIADTMSVSQASTTVPIISQNMSSEAVAVKSDKVDVKGIALNSEDQRNGISSAPELGVAAASRSENSWKDVEHLFEGYDEQQKAAIHRERARRIEEQNKMFASRKLCLVLDLDHTLLNSAKFVEVDPVHDEILRKKEEQDREKPWRHLFRFPHMAMWTKLRPGIWNFLEKASKLYELHLYTMGNKLYATEMAKVLDPKGVLFAGRVISRGDDGDPFDGDERVPKSKDLEGVLGMESAVVIIDDSVRVWPHNKLNLIVVERYTYFPCSRRQFGLQGPSLLEIDHDERPEEGTLASSLSVIERIHQDFFSHQSLDEADVRTILAAAQRKILSGCRIVFSRVFPVGEANPHLHPLWQTAEQFGAVCTNQIDEQVTHVVANSLGTDKVNWALSTGRFVVYPGWVEASALLYRRANEREFAIKS
nr:rna polymerase ii c-terminal domain phosphatase-like 3 [Quercus suber]